MEGGPPGFPQGFTCPAVLGNSPGWPSVSDTGLSPAVAGLSRPFSYRSANATSRSRNPGKQAFRFGLLRFRSPLLAESQLMSSPPGTEMFHFPGYGFRTLFDSGPDGGIAPAGLPHSEARGSKPATAPRGFSQFAASFVALWCQGIRRVPVYA